MAINSGSRFCRLTVLKKVPDSRSRYICKCDCGNTIEVYGSRLKTGHTKSCGCLNEEQRKKLIKQRSLKHGMTNTILYSKYCSMKARCYNHNYKYYHRYGGRGIKVCQEWMDSFQSFADWAYANGYDDQKSGYEQTLDRIDNNQDYCPDNCRWVNQKVQVKNRSISTHIYYNGEDLNYTEFANKYHIDSEAFVRRHYSKGDSPEKIISDWEKSHSNDKYYSINQAAELCRVSVQTIYNWIYKKKIDAIKIGTQWYIAKDSV